MATRRARSSDPRFETGLVWQRRDFRESSRLITFVTPDHGRLTTLGKGAHRPGSQCLGRIDFLNLVEIKCSKGQLPVLHRVRLLHEHRGLREPRRYAAAGYLAELFDKAFLAGRPDPELFDLLSGGLLLIERCPIPALRQILLGLELRFLREQGVQPALDACAECGAPLPAGGAFLAPQHPGLACARHRGGSPAVADETLRWLRHIDQSPGRRWPGLPPPPPQAARLLGRWIQHALERRPRSRPRALGA